MLSVVGHRVRVDGTRYEVPVYVNAKHKKYKLMVQSTRYLCTLNTGYEVHVRVMAEL